MSFEPTERQDFDSINESRQEMLSYIVFLEETLEQAEKLGHEGDPEMFEVLKKIDGAKEELALYGAESKEPIPNRNYEEAAEKIKVKFLPKIVKNLVLSIKNGEKEKGEIDQIVDIISYYNEEYPELELASILSDI